MEHSSLHPQAASWKQYKLWNKKKFWILLTGSSQPKTFTSISSSALPTVLYETFVYKAALLGSLVLTTELIKWIIYMKSEEIFIVGH